MLQRKHADGQATSLQATTIRCGEKSTRIQKQTVARANCARTIGIEPFDLRSTRQIIQV